MVDISSGDKKINITVSTSGNKASVNATPDIAMYYSNKSREWAISDKIVSNEDYSSKYYANESKKQAETVKDKITEVNNAVEVGITNIINQENISVDNVNTAGETQVNLAKEQAIIATNKAEEASEIVDNAVSNIVAKSSEQIELIQNEGATQIANVQSTGFYMRDDKLYFINSQGEETEFKSGGSGLEVCDIGTALYVDETKGLRRYLNGQIVDINTNTQAFLNRLKEITTLHPSLLCTEDEWQTAKTMSAFGQVGKFVLNYVGNSETVVSVRIPAIVNIQGLFDLQNLGMTVEAGLPNHTHALTLHGRSGNDAGVNRDASWGYDDWAGVNSTATTTQVLNNSVYGNSNTVQQEAIQYPYFIQIATGSETENNIVNDIELNNPFSLFDSKYSDHELNNLSWLKSEGQWNAKAVYPDAYDKLLKVYNGTETVEGLSVKLSTETYTDYDFVLNTAEETFRLPLKTKQKFYDEIAPVIGNGTALGLTDGTNYGGIVARDSIYGKLASYGQQVGTVAPSSIWNSGSDKALGLTTDPTKSGIETHLIETTLYLYFYVGETVQNANLIDAGRIGEQLANKQDKCIHIIDTYVNGTSGYRIWSNGYCEQWGYKSGTNEETITFLKAFKDNNYNVTLASEDKSQKASAYYYNKTSTSMTLNFNTTTAAGASWSVAGYII